MIETMDSFAGNKLLFGSGRVDFFNKTSKFIVLINVHMYTIA